MRPSRRRLRQLLRMRNFLNAIDEVPHPEEARSAISKDAGRSCSPPFANPFTGSQERDRHMPEPTNRSHSKPVITATAAQLFVSDIKESCDFFTQKLGFSTV